MKIAICDDDNLHFNPRSHVGNDLVYCCRCGNHLNFNPRSHVGNDAGSVSILRRNIISIHVPTWGTTSVKLANYSGIVISIHVPTWGTTVSTSPFLTAHDKFQSTFPRGERPSVNSPTYSVPLFQSTFPRGERHLTEHTPAPLIQHFNPRSHVGND